jgi:hypothetical protein
MKKLYLRITFIIIAAFVLSGLSSFASNPSVARQWNEALIFSIRKDFARPTIHARNLFHMSMAMYDAWAVYDSSASTYLLGKTLGNFTCEFNGIIQPENIQVAREEAISYACYRLLKQRFQYSPNATNSLLYYDSLMFQLGYPTDFYSQDYSDGNPAALGNYIAAKILEFGLSDGANQQGNYANQYYETVNPQIVVNNPGNPNLVDPNRWQAIFLDEFIDQSGNVISISPPFLSPEWGDVVPFCLDESHKNTYERDGNQYNVFMDPGAPPYIDTTQLSDIEDPYKWGFSMVSVWQSHLDPSSDVVWDISPASIGNNTPLPETPEDYPSFYNYLEGGDQSQGRTINPKTGLPYEPQLVKRGDYARVLAEFWADGPNSETPPGHWFTILNYVSDHPQVEKRWNGQGEILSDLDWDIKSYFTLAGAMHDAAISAWSAKGWYDYPRPVSIIRWMAEKGQSTDPNLPRFHNAGIPLVDGKIELVMPGDPLAGDNDENLYKIKLYTWKGHAYIENPETDVAGVDWILAENWWTYQRPTFVTPPFAGFISGHSTFSRTAAEVMTLITGDTYFPGGMGEFHAGQNEFLHFEEGPSQDIVLQWATYQDASDQCSLSRIWGGIHPPQDDIPGRKIGIELGPLAFNHALTFLEAGQAHVNEITVSAPVLNDATVNTGLDVMITFNKAMNESLNPNIEFTNGDISNALTVSNTEWINETTFHVHYAVADINSSVNNIGVKVSNAADTSGLAQRIYLQNDILDIEMSNPSIVSSSINYNQINIAVAASDTLTATLVFSEPMNTGLMLVPTIESSATEVNLEIDPSGCYWSDDYTCHLAWFIHDFEEECPEIVISFSNALNTNGNPSVESAIDEVITIDTKRPFLEIVTASTYLIDQSNVENEYQILAVFQESMNQTVTPILSFLNSVDVSQILNLNTQTSGWLSNYTYRFRYSLIPQEINIEDVNVRVNGAQDFIGNEMIPDTLANFLNIELDPLSIATSSKTASSTIFPNPIIQGQTLVIKAELTSGPTQIILRNNAGQLLKEITDNFGLNDEIKIETSSLPSGLYNIQIKNNTRTEMLQLVVVQ